MSNRSNLANGFIATTTVSTGATSFDLNTGSGATMPSVPFKITVAPFGQLPTKGNSEIMLVTALSGETMTVARAQDGTTARTFAAGDIVSNAMFVSDITGVNVTVTTARTTAAKVGTTADGNYVPAVGDRLNVTFTLGVAVDSPTLNIDGSGAKNIRIADVNVSTLTLSTGAVSVVVPLWYDGTYYQMYGSHLNTNMTYTEITSAEITTGTASTVRGISGRRSEEIVAKAVAAAMNAVNTQWLALLPVGAMWFGGSNPANPSTYLPGMSATTWVSEAEGMTIVGVDTSQTEFDTVNKTGGAKTHTLTTPEMPAHAHLGQYPNGGAGGSAYFAGGLSGPNGYANSNMGGTNVSSLNAGNGQAHNNLQPYKTKYIWTRTA